MARPPRCLLDDLSADRPELDRATRHHLGRVLRLRPGDDVELVDGRGALAHGRWEADGRVVITARDGTAPAPTPRVLAVVPPRPSRLDWLVEKGAELGLTGLWLMSSDHAARDVGAARVERLNRKAVEAMLQCRRLHAMEVRVAGDLDAVLAGRGDGALWLACAPPDDGSAVPLPRVDPRRPLLMLVGPEGGFTDEEQHRAREAGAAPVVLGRGVLRVETAGLALAVLAGTT